MGDLSLHFDEVFCLSLPVSLLPATRTILGLKTQRGRRPPVARPYERNNLNLLYALQWLEGLLLVDAFGI